MKKEHLSFNPLGQWDLQKSDEDWLLGEDYESRDSMDRMEGNDRNHALNHLSSHTQSRQNEHTGQTEYLLHRGVGEQEAWAHDDKDIQDNTSWTPHYHVAHNFSRSYNSSEGSKVHKDHTISAWVPENHIHSIPMHNHKDEDFDNVIRGEHEVVIQPHKFNYADQDTRDSLHASAKKAKLI